jgi:SAM-dependent methyltransferase
VNNKREYSDKAALRGEPSYVWRAGQERRLQMIVGAAEDRIHGRIMEDGCGVGTYMQHLLPFSRKITGLDFDFERVVESHTLGVDAINAAGEHLPYPENHFDLVMSNEVIEHVQDDRLVIHEIIRVLKSGGRLVLFCPNLGYPFETHGIFWRGKYHFGNIPLVNYLPRKMRNKLAPHVRVYSRGGLTTLFQGLPVRMVQQTIIFGGYDNLVIRWGALGRIIRWIMQALERTPLRWFGLSHFWVVEKERYPLFKESVPDL